MPNKEKDMESAIINDEDSYGTKIKSTPVPPKQIGIDTEDVFTDNLLDAADINKVDIESIKKYYPAVEKIGDNEIHIVVGTDANVLANEFKKFVI